MENIVHPTRRLGRKPAVLPPNVRALTDYIDAKRLPPTPERVVNSGTLTSFPMFANDKLGDCTCAAVAHQARAWLYANGNRLEVSDDEVIDLYKQFGYEGTPDTDKGAVEAEVLHYWQRHPQFGVSLDGVASVNPRAISMIKACCYLMGGCYIGVNLPWAVANLDNWPKPPHLSGDWASGSWGGHAVTVLDADYTGFICISWGKKLHIAPEFILAYCSEAWALLSNEWADENGAPNGMDYDQLSRDLPALRHG